MMQAVDYEYWNDFLFREGAICSPAELHGVLCAGHCVNSQNWFEMVLTVLDVERAQASPALTAALEALHEIVAKTLRDESFGLKLMLPDDALPIRDRLQALSDWCHGFLHGFGELSEARRGELDEEGREALQDLAKIAELDAQVDASEENETYYSELVEYIRVVTLTLFSGLNKPSPSEQVVH